MWYLSISFILLLGFASGQFERKLEYTIQENQPSGIQLGHISSDMTSSQKNGESKLADPSYMFVMRDKNEYFQLDSKSSALKTDKTIDLEMLCPKYCNDKGTGFINLVVNVWKVKQLRGVIQVKIVVTDQNDNVPTFPVKVFEKKIKEVLYGVGKIIELPKAIDRDITAENNKVAYKLSEDCDTFRLQVTNDSNPRLILTKDIDFEMKVHYSLMLIAWNQKSPSLKSFLEIKIEVIDINDCEPVFQNTLMELMLDENSKVGKLIMKISAIDKDVNSRLTYGMIAATKQINKDTFTVKEGGEVILIKELDVESQKEYDLPVFATDGEFTANAKIRIVVRDVNNHPPSYNLNPASISIEENQPPDILVGQVIISDIDSTEVNGDIRCKEPQGKSNLQSLLFRPDPEENPTILKYDMYTRDSLDREKRALALIYLICQDGGLHERLTSTLTVSLVILDVNDNPPEFVKKMYNAEMKENNAIGDKVTQVEAIDKDYKENALIVYSIMNGPNSNMFFIDENTGWINVMRELDREESDNFQLIILATNKPPKYSATSSTTLNIKVIDLNDNHPQLRPPSQFTFMENMKTNTFIGNINAVDKDSEGNGKLLFSSLSNQFDPLFEVKKNGSIFSKIAFDREAQERYCLNIRVSDNGQPLSLSVTGTICIIIMDANDNKPVISVISSQNEVPLIERNVTSTKGDDVIVASVYEAAGYKVASVLAEDVDKDENAQISFTMEEVNDGAILISSLFMIDENDGSIKISQVMSRDHIGEYRIKIIAHDKGKPILKTEKVIRIQIKDMSPHTTLVQNANVQVTGNVLIVIILSIISAFLTALLVGAILCMIRPCCQAESYPSHDHQDSRNINGQTLLHKSPPNYFTVNPYDPQTYDPQWMQTLARNGHSFGNSTLDFHQNNALDKMDYCKYESPRMYTSQNTLCPVKHVMGKPSGCSCGQGMCIRYPSHNGNNYLLSNPEEQCSDSGRGASDDDQKALNGNGSLINTLRQPAAVNGDVSSKSMWRETCLQNIPNEREEQVNEESMMFDQENNSFMTQISFGQVSHIPMTTFQSSHNLETMNQSSKFRSDSCESLSSYQKKSNTVLFPANSEVFPTNKKWGSFDE